MVTRSSALFAQRVTTVQMQYMDHTGVTQVTTVRQHLQTVLLVRLDMLVHNLKVGWAGGREVLSLGAERGWAWGLRGANKIG